MPTPASYGAADAASADVERHWDALRADPVRWAEHLRAHDEAERQREDVSFGDTPLDRRPRLKALRAERLAIRARGAQSDEADEALRQEIRLTPAWGRARAALATGGKPGLPPWLASEAGSLKMITHHPRRGPHLGPTERR